MTTNIRSSADGSKSHIAVGGEDRITIDAATGKLTSTYSPPTGERSLALATMQKFADEFGSSLAASGYQKLPSGLIIQWGSTLFNTSGYANITFPISFPTAVYEITSSVGRGSVLTGYLMSTQIGSLTTSSAQIYGNFSTGGGIMGLTSSECCNWIAFGK